MNLVDYFIHAANVLLLLAYSVRDILWLRVFAVASSLIAIPYFLLQPAPLWAPFAWSILFAGINIFQSWRVFLERRPVKLTADEEFVRGLLFADLPPRKALQAISIGAWTTTQPGERLIESGKPATAISLIVEGTARISRNERVIGELGTGAFVGSALLLAGAPANVDAVAMGRVRALRWEVDALESYLAANPATRIAIQRHLARDLASKLERSTK